MIADGKQRSGANDDRRRRWLRRAIAILFWAVAPLAPAALAQPIPINTIVNPGFETGTGGQAVNNGWTTAPNFGPMFVVDQTVLDNVAPNLPYLEAIDPNSPFEGAQYLTGNRNAGSFGTNESMGVRQDVDLSPWASYIDVGGRGLNLSFAYNDADPADSGVVSFSFLDAVSAPIGQPYMFETDSAPTGGGSWSTTSILGEVPTMARTMRISLLANQGPSGTLRNVSYDAVSAELLPSMPTPPIADRVNGNLIQLDSDGTWTWYTQERSIVDPNNGHVLVNSVGFASWSGNGGTGEVDVVDFDPTTGRRVRTRLSNQQPGNPNIQVDDHNVGSLLVLPDGRYLAMYANHGNSGGLGDEWSRWRRSVNPGDSTSWTTEQLYNWHTEVPGAEETGNSNAGNVTYHNLFYLSAEDQVYNISRSYGQLSTNGATQNMPNIMRYDVETNTVEWAGQVLESVAQGYSAYPKYASNGVDRIYFISTETHPRDFNNNIYSGYIQNGQTFDMLGNVIDDNLFDNGTTAGGSGFVADVTDFTIVHQADPLGEGYNRLWTVDMNLDADGDPMALYISRWNPDGSTSNGSTTNPIDHRLHFGDWNSQTSDWESHEVARMGNRLYRLPNDMSEQDYTGNAALVPGDPSTIYISTPFDPRDPAGETFTTSYEIYKGVTADGGANWSWTAITENSNYDNLRPIVPDSHGGDNYVIWFRGIYTTAHNIDAAIVGIIDRDEAVGPVNYVDANATNTTFAGGGSLVTSTPSGSQGPADNMWHQRTGFGNQGDVLSSNESGSENAPLLKTTLDGLDDGQYDVFAYFWSDVDEDWRLQAGLEQDNLIDFRRFGSQHADEDQFAEIETVTANSNDLLLYRAYLGRTEVAAGSPIDVFVDDYLTGNNQLRNWYDGVGYALIGAVEPLLAGDYNGDGKVNAADYVMLRNNLDTDFVLLNETATPGMVTQEDYEVWRDNFGNELGATAVVPEPIGVVLMIAAIVQLLAVMRTSRDRNAR